MRFPNDGKKWTAEEDARVVRALVAVTPRRGDARRLADELGRTACAVSARAQALRLNWKRGTSK